MGYRHLALNLVDELTRLEAIVNPTDDQIDRMIDIHLRIEKGHAIMQLGMQACDCFDPYGGGCTGHN